ncbi:hypothetical protein [Acidocella sp.]|uniref:hypothetical protein n=1 Tax=Acidocella sp. TaxID=50710 RepID=UPI0026167919|nr:hypothetical protein [Acidocella sp.]
MSKLAFLPLIIITITAILAWAMARHREIAGAQREAAASRPRSRPYATTLPECLTQR